MLRQLTSAQYAEIQAFNRIEQQPELIDPQAEAKARGDQITDMFKQASARNNTVH